MKEPLVSVIVTTYNHKDYIKTCLDSVLMQQTNFPFEIILGEDESMDGTREICMGYAQEHPDKIKLFLRSRKDVIYINGKPTGRYNFIASLKEASGQYIALCEGDDYWTDPLKLQKQVDFLNNNKDFHGVFHNVNFKEKEKIRPWRKYDFDVYDAIDVFRTASLFHTSSYLFRRLDFMKLNDSKLVSGDMMLLGLIAKNGKMKLLNEIMSVYRKHPGGVTDNDTMLSFHQHRIYLNKKLNKHFNFEFDRKAKEIIKYHKTEVLKIKYRIVYLVLAKIKKLVKNL